MACTVTQYVGARYVPLFADPLDWDNSKTYEPLTIVYYQGNSYTSRQTVPAGIDIKNNEYWALTGNYNAQIEQYRQEVLRFDERITTAQSTADAANTAASEAKTAADAAQDTADAANTAASEAKTAADAAQDTADAANTAASEAKTAADAAQDTADAAKTAADAAQNTADAAQNTADAAVLNSKRIKTSMPMIIGTDFIPNKSDKGNQIQYSCCVKVGNNIFGFAPLNNTANTTIVRKYDTVNNTISSLADITAGHANSCAYVESASRIYVLWGYGTPEVADDRSLCILTSSGAIERTKQTTSHFHGISYDSSNGKLYGITNWNYDAKTVDLKEITPGTLDEKAVGTIDFSAMGGAEGILQDIAIDNGTIYLSMTDGVVGVCNVSNNMKIDYTFKLTQIDANGQYYLNELEGFEFDDEHNLIAAYSYRCYEAGVMAYTCLITGNINLIYNEHQGASRSFLYDSEMASKFSIDPYYFRSLAELITRIRNIVNVNISEDFTDPGFSQIVFLNSLKLAIGANVTLPPLLINAPSFGIFVKDGATLTMQKPSSTSAAYAISTGTLENTALNLNMTGTYTNNTGLRDIQLANTKAVLSVGNLGSNTMTFAETGTGNAAENTLYIGARHKIASEKN